MPRLSIRLDRLAQPVDVKPGGEIVLRGSFKSTYDGSTIDAKTTTSPAEAPGGASVDSGGLIDFDGGGFHVTSRDPVTHEVHAVATGDSGAACAAFGVTSPCLPLRVRRQAQSRLLTDSAWIESLKGGIEVEIAAPPPVPSPAAEAVSVVVPWLGVGAALLAVAAAGFLGWNIKKRRAASPTGQLLTLAARVREKLKRADAVVAAPLAPAIDAALRALRERRVDASSIEGKRVMAVLVRVDARLDDSVAQARAEEEQQAADELVREVESALEAVDEANALGPRPRATTRAEP